MTESKLWPQNQRKHYHEHKVLTFSVTYKTAVSVVYVRWISNGDCQSCVFSKSVVYQIFQENNGDVKRRDNFISNKQCSGKIEKDKCSFAPSRAEGGGGVSQKDFQKLLKFYMNLQKFWGMLTILYINSTPVTGDMNLIMTKLQL